MSDNQIAENICTIKIVLCILASTFLYLNSYSHFIEMQQNGPNLSNSPVKNIVPKNGLRR